MFEVEEFDGSSCSVDKEVGLHHFPQCIRLSCGFGSTEQRSTAYIASTFRDTSFYLEPVLMGENTNMVQHHSFPNLSKWRYP